MLSELLIEAVAAGGSVSFMHPLARDAAMASWNDALVAGGERSGWFLGAWSFECMIKDVIIHYRENRALLALGRQKPI